MRRGRRGSEQRVDRSGQTTGHLSGSEVELVKGIRRWPDRDSQPRVTARLWRKRFGQIVAQSKRTSDIISSPSLQKKNGTDCKVHGHSSSIRVCAGRNWKSSRKRIYKTRHYTGRCFYASGLRTLVTFEMVSTKAETREMITVSSKAETREMVTMSIRAETREMVAVSI